jgi:hypothetical protein
LSKWLVVQSAEALLLHARPRYKSQKRRGPSQAVSVPRRGLFDAIREMPAAVVVWETPPGSRGPHSAAFLASGPCTPFPLPRCWNRPVMDERLWGGADGGLRRLTKNLKGRVPWTFDESTSPAAALGLIISKGLEGWFGKGPGYFDS